MKLGHKGPRRLSHSAMNAARRSRTARLKDDPELIAQHKDDVRERAGVDLERGRWVR